MKPNISKTMFICVIMLIASMAQAISITQEELLGTWNVKNVTVDPIYSDTRGKVTFHQDGTITVDEGAFAAAGIFAANEYSTCSNRKGPIRYKQIGKGEFYLYWKGEQVNKKQHWSYHKKHRKPYKKLDAVIELIKRKTKVKEGKTKTRLTFIGQGGCATHPGVVKVSYLKKKINAPQEPELECKQLLSEDENACKEDFFHTGSDQLMEVPTGAKYMEVKAWGAGGNRDNGARGGVGGYTTAVIPVTAGDEYSVIAGRWGNNGGTENYGFGGSGGGLSGIFTGTEPVLSSDQARAVIIAGGGGSSSDGAFGIRNGFDGNDLSNLTVSGDMAANCRTGRGGGGAGYEGGLSSGSCSSSNRTVFGYGGSGFIASIAESLYSSIETGFINCFSASIDRKVPANYLDEDWQRVAEEPCKGPGTEESFSNQGAAVIVEWLDELP